MTFKHKLLALAFVSTAVTGVASAQTPPPAPGERMQPPATREEALARADRQFARLDTNKDGQVTLAEMTAARDARMAKRPEGAPRGGGRMGERMLARLDTDRNGSISQAEFRAAALARFQRIDTNGDGRIDATEAQAMQDRRMSRRGGGADTGE